MIGKADRRRPLAVAIALVAIVTAALVVPVVIGARGGKPMLGTQVRADSRDSVVIAAPLSLSSAPSITIEKGTVALAGTGAEESRVAALLRTLVMGNGADLVLDGARIVIDRRPGAGPGGGVPSQGARATAEDLAPVVAALSGFKFRSLALLDSVIVLRTAHGSTEKFSNVALEIAPQRHGLVGAKGRVEYRGEPLDVDLVFTPPRADGAAAPIEVRAVINGAYAALNFHGRLAPGERGITARNAELVVPDLRAAAGWLGVQWPSGSGFDRFSAKGSLTLDERMLSFENAEFTLDGNAATGALIAKIGPERASIEGTLAFASFDIAPYVAAPSPPALALALASDWLSWIRPPGPASLAFLREADADIRISAANVTNGSERLGRLAASFSIRDGKAYGELAELELDQGGGSGEGQFTVDVTGTDPRFTLNAALTDLELERLAATGLGAAALDGAADLRIDVTASGASEAEIVRSLAGKISVDMSDGGRVGLDVSALPQVADKAAPAERWGQAGSGATSVSRLTARFTAVDGILTTDSFEAISDDRTITAQGTIDIDSNALDLLLSVAPSPAVADVQAAGKATGAYRIRGPWGAPTISRADPGKAASTAMPVADPG